MRASIFLFLLIFIPGVLGSNQCEQVLDRQSRNCKDVWGYPTTETLSNYCIEYDIITPTGVKHVVQSKISCKTRNSTEPTRHYDVDLSCLRILDWDRDTLERANMWSIGFSDYAFDPEQKDDVLRELYGRAAASIATGTNLAVSFNDTQMELKCDQIAIQSREPKVVDVSKMRILSESIHHRHSQKRIIIELAPLVEKARQSCRSQCEMSKSDFTLKATPRHVFLPFWTMPELQKYYDREGMKDKFFKSECKCAGTLTMQA